MNLNALKNIIDESPELFRLFRGCPYEILGLWELHQYPTGTIICFQGDTERRG